MRKSNTQRNMSNTQKNQRKLRMLVIRQNQSSLKVTNLTKKRSLKSSTRVLS